MSSLIRTRQVNLSAAAAVQLLSANTARRRVYLTIPVAASVYIGSDSTVSSLNGFPFGSASSGTLPDRIELNTTAEVWAVWSGVASTVSILEELA